MTLDAKTGATLSRFPFRSRSYESVNAACPVVVGADVFLSASYKTGGVLLRKVHSDPPEVRWRSDALGTHFNTAIPRDGHLYGFDGRNEPDASLVCQRIEDGTETWREALEWDETFELRGRTLTRAFSPYRGQLLHADGHFLALGEWGHLLWLDLTPEGCTVLARHWLFPAQESWTPPVVSRGLLYVVQNARSAIDGSGPRLLCYDLRGEN